MGKYIEKINSNVYPIEEKNIIENEEEMWETIILSLRLNKGLDIKEFNNKYKVDFIQKYCKALNKLKNNRLVELSDNCLKLTPLGSDLSNTVFIEFL